MLKSVHTDTHAVCEDNTLTRLRRGVVLWYAAAIALTLGSSVKTAGALSALRSEKMLPYEVAVTAPNVRALTHTLTE